MTNERDRNDKIVLTLLSSNDDEITAEYLAMTNEKPHP
jgi:hypothetical protein